MMGDVVNLMDQRPDSELPDDAAMLDHLLARTSTVSQRYGTFMRWRRKVSMVGNLSASAHDVLVTIYLSRTLWAARSGADRRADQEARQAQA